MMRAGLKIIEINTILLVFEILLVIIFSLLNLAVTVGSHWAWTNIIGSDGAAVVLSAISHNYGLGAPYQDYWEYRPPGYLLLIDSWVKIFGFKVLSFKLLELIVRFGIGLEICFLAKKIFSPFQAFIVSGLTLFVFFSPSFGTLMLAEPYGLFFSLLGLVALFYIKSVNRKFFLAAFLLSLAGQMKDSYVWTFVAIVPAIFYFIFLRNYKYFFQGLIFTLLGLLIQFSLLIFYLINVDGLRGYLEMWLFKSETFHVRIWENINLFLRLYYDAFTRGLETFFRFTYLFGIILLIWLLLFLLPLVSKKKLSFKLLSSSLTLWLTTEKLNTVIFLFYSLGMLIGFALNKGFSPHYLIMIIVPLCFFWPIILSSIESYLRIYIARLPRNIIFLPTVFVLLFPQSWIINRYSEIPPNFLLSAYQNLTVTEGDTSAEEYIGMKTRSQDCILSLYGWKSPEVYLFSQRKPCSRFFQPNVVNEEWQKKEYREAILNNPPKAIVYSLEGADMDVVRFEKEVIDISQILNDCYRQDYTFLDNSRWPLNLYFPLFSNQELRACLQKVEKTKK